MNVRELSCPRFTYTNPAFPALSVDVID
jgi:hypothetical protein